jgi:hypothetical protein
VTIKKAIIDRSKFNRNIALPYQLRLEDFEMAMGDVYDFLYDVNNIFVERGLQRIDDMLRPASMSGVLSDMLNESLGKHSRALSVNTYFNGHPDLVLSGRYPNNSVKSGDEGVEIKATVKKGGAVDAHGARDEVLCAFVYVVDKDASKPALDRDPTVFTEVYIASVLESDFRLNARGPLGTRTATLHAAGLKKWRQGWVYKA